MVQQAVFPLILIPVLLALGLAVSPRFTLRLIGWFIAVNLLFVGCIFAIHAARGPSPPADVSKPERAEAPRAAPQKAAPARPVSHPPR